MLPVDIRLSAHTNRLRFRPRAYSFIGSVPFFDVFDKPLSGWDSIIKASEDRIIAAITLLLASPVMALVALAIKLDSRGPVFFKQNRYGTSLVIRGTDERALDEMLEAVKTAIVAAGETPQDVKHG